MKPPDLPKARRWQLLFAVEHRYLPDACSLAVLGMEEAKKDREQIGGLWKRWVSQGLALKHSLGLFTVPQISAPILHKLLGDLDLKPRSGSRLRELAYGSMYL